MPKNFIDPILSLILATQVYVGLDQKFFFTPFYMPIPREAPTWRYPWHVQVVLSYLAKNTKLNVDSLLTKDLLLCSWSVPSWSSSPAECWHCTDLRAQCQVCLRCARVCTSPGFIHFAKHTVSIKSCSWPAEKLNCCQIHMHQKINPS